MDQFSSLVVDRAPIFASVAVLLGAAFLVSVLVPSSGSNGKIPLVGGDIGNAEQRRKAFLSNAKDLYAKGYRHFKDSVWRLTDTDGMFQFLELPCTIKKLGC
jgi:hypothetical protein